MGRSINVTITLIIAILIVLCLVLINSESTRKLDKDTYEKYIKEDNLKIKKLQKRFDSLRRQDLILKKHYIDVSTAYQKSRNEVSKANKKYEKAHNSKPIPYTDPQIDSILTVFYGQH